MGWEEEEGGGCGYERSTGGVLLCNRLTLGELREVLRPLGRFRVTSCELNSFRIQVHTKSTQAGLRVYTSDHSRDSARTVPALLVGTPRGRSRPSRRPRKNRAGAEPRGARKGASFDWATEVPVTPEGPGFLGAGLVTSRAWSLAKPAGRGGQEGGAPRLPVGALKGREEAGAGAVRAGLDAPGRRPGLVVTAHLSRTPPPAPLVPGPGQSPRSPSPREPTPSPGERPRRRLHRVQAPGDLGGSVGRPSRRSRQDSPHCPEGVWRSRRPGTVYWGSPGAWCGLLGRSPAQARLFSRTTCGCSHRPSVPACLPLTWEVKGPHGPGKRQEGAGSREIWGFPLSSLHPSLPEDVVHSAPLPLPPPHPPRQDQVSALSSRRRRRLSCQTFLTKRVSQLLGDAAQTCSTPSATTHRSGQSLRWLLFVRLQDGPPSSWSRRANAVPVTRPHVCPEPAALGPQHPSTFWLWDQMGG
ncbi:uncharacterized protein LOC103000302 [Balaenoptera acutorostrata]|uniref:Uncharacterized protein LOC103000302 n=1 Tax=Balaenoptera acutorostrata TaxID=9767 RepID=A0ABM3SV37_BALAC|nr:uncharacterized protein LOC130706335 [Balaenoptera acutorostrata]XP_057393706.1 uncharacterized protein LOC103000302 [Balaenoptera acutorostrata]